jgi:putative heme-binding domain-containing protein
LYVASHPSIWKLEDPEGQGVATRRTELVTGFRFNGNGCDIHGPFLGPDGRLYWTDGRHGYKVKTREGTTLEGLASRIWRCRTDGSAVERLCGGGFDNPVELAWTPDGELIGTMDQGPGDALLHFVEGGVYPMEHPCLHEFPRTGPLLGSVRQYSPVLPAALCGLTSYRSAVFGKEYTDTLFSTHYMVHKVVRHTLVRDGSTFRAEDADFLTTSDHGVRFTDVLEDADGSLLVIDMGNWFTYGFPGNPLPRPEALGAIYRVRRAGVRVADPSGTALRLATRTPGELAALLDDERPAVRDQVVGRLARLGAAAVPALEAVLRLPTRLVRARQNAVWALCRIQAPAARASLRLALADKAAGVRSAAVHALGLERDAEAVTGLCALVRGDEAPIRRKAAEALGRIGRPEAVPALLDGLRRGGDRFLEHSLIYALIQINDRTATLPALRAAVPRVRRAGLIALDQMRDGHLDKDEVSPLLEADDADLQQAALEVVGKRPAWSDLARSVLRKWLVQPRLSPTRERILTGFLQTSGGEAAVQAVVTEALAHARTAPAVRSFLLSTVGSTRIDPLPPGWVEGVRRALEDTDIGVQRAALAVVKTRYSKECDAQLARLARRSGLPADPRIAALECLAARRKQLDPEAFTLLTGQLAESADPLSRLAAARALAGGPLADDQLLELARSLKSCSTLVLRLLLPVFSRARNPAVGKALIQGLKEAPGAEALTLAELDAVLAGYPETVRHQARGLREKLAERQKGQAAYLARLTRELADRKGDADAGQEVFLSAKAACYGCHRAVGRGGNVGPDLSRIGRIRTRAELLESIIFPSLTIAPEYRSHQVTTRDGRVVTGLVLRETGDALYLRTTDLREVRIARTNVEDLSPSAVSLVPDGLEKLLSKQELCDLLEFLTRQR